MKKVILLLFLVTLTSVSAKSQAVIALLFGDKIKSDNIGLGLFIGEQGSFITGAETLEFRPNLSLSLGAYIDVKIGHNDKWILQNYILFKSPKGAAGLDVKSELLAADSLVITHTDMIQRKLSYLQVTPVMRYCLSPTWSVGVGPYAALLARGHDIYSVKKNEGDLSYNMKMRDKFNWIDFGLALDLQCRLMKGKGLQFNLHYEQGLIEIYKQSTGLSGKNMTFHIGAGIPIKGKNAKMSHPSDNF